MSAELRVIPVEGMPEVEEGAKVGQLIAERAELQDGDVVVISQKIVSKAEGQVRRLAEVQPSERAQGLANRLGKEAALVELVLSESAEVLRAERDVLITETHHGFVCANAGIDASNLPEDGTVCLLPTDPDASARRIREELAAEGEPGGGGPRPHRSRSPSLSPTASGAHGDWGRWRWQSAAPD
jgi:coenzyme F420-0:L-glutamate ligase/coenzyme F420-1:gamma-L-glutamate ligase